MDAQARHVPVLALAYVPAGHTDSQVELAELRNVPPGQLVQDEAVFAHVAQEELQAAHVSAAVA